ncbi:MAG TPA: beta-ketoacyl-ACP synthase III [Bacillota bacterium]|nr:beta-ketoacyl-ACP synthase III [Bacillota bacterium]
MYTKILGTGSALPKQRVTNEDLAMLVDTSNEWITSRTGISERWISTGESASYLAAEAAAKALADADVEPSQIDLVISATVSPDNFTPTVSCEAQKALGLSRATCFDLWAGCTGFIFSLMTADALVKSGLFSHALVIGVEVLSKLVDWQDRSTCVLFGDGAGAVVLSSASQPGLVTHVSGSDGTRGDVLKIAGIPLANPWMAQHVGESETGSQSVICMNGQEVFKFAVKTMESSIRRVVELSGSSLHDISYIIPHQANNRIIESVAGRMKIPREKFFTNLDHRGNTSSASIPMALDEMNRAGLLLPGMHLVLVGFGGGLTWGASMVRWTR